MLFLTTFALLASAAIAAPSVDQFHLEMIIDDVIADIIRTPLSTIDGISLKGLASLKRTKCQLENNKFTCTAVADRALVNLGEDEDFQAKVTIPITLVLNGNKFENFEIGQPEVEITDERAFESSGLFGFWKKVKHAIGKAGKAIGKVAKSAAQIALEAAKEAARAKAAALAAKAIGVIVG